LRLTIDGRPIFPENKFGDALTEVEKHSIVRVELRHSLMGGKGGFGSLLRSMKPKAKGDENFEACRDLSGRRLRQVNNEQRLIEHHARQEEEEKNVANELEEYNKHKQALKS